MKNEWIVTPEESGIKLLQFLKQKLPAHFSLKQIKKAIDLNHCLLNERIERFSSTLVGRGDHIVFDPPDINIIDQSKSTPPKIQSLYEDKDLLASNKPPGVPFDQPQWIKSLEKHAGTTLYPIHRLDRDTTGVQLFAKSKDILQKCIDLFKSLSVKKEYDALVDGIPKNPKGIIQTKLGIIGEYQGQKQWGVVDDPKGLSAVTRWTLKQSGKQAAWLKCYPETGRTHQIRVHLSSIGHPILGDGQYGKKFHCPFRPKRHLLHATSIKFPHPTTGKTIEIVAPLPQDFLEATEHCL